MIRTGFKICTNRWPCLNLYLQNIFDRPSFQSCAAEVDMMVEKGRDAFLSASTQKMVHIFKI